MRLITLALAAALPFAAHAEGGHGDDDHLTKVDGVEILHAWARATDHGHTAVYVEITNKRDAAITLTGGDAHGLAETVKLMGAPLKAGGEPVMLPELPIAPGTEMVLGPQTVYLQLDGLSRHLHKGEEFEMHLELEPIGEVEIHVEVEAENADNHSHAGHNH